MCYYLQFPLFFIILLNIACNSRLVYALNVPLRRSAIINLSTRIFRAHDTKVDTFTSLDRFPQTLIIPKFLKNLNIFEQTMIVISFFWLHTEYLSQKAIALPFELSPTSISSIGLDTLCGLTSILASYFYHVRNNLVFPSLFQPTKVPWRRPRQHPIRSFLTILSIFLIYYGMSYIFPIISLALDHMSAVFELSVPMHRNLGVVLCHICWVLPSLALTSSVKGFFGHDYNVSKVEPVYSTRTAYTDSNYALDDKGLKPTLQTMDISLLPPNKSDDEQIRNIPNNDNIGTSFVSLDRSPLIVRHGREERSSFWKPTAIGGSDWMTLSMKSSNWVWWVVGGYSVSVLLFRMSDWVNQLIPSNWIEEDHIVNLMIRPETSGVWALVVGAMAPCLSAPWWEEIFYRGLIFPWLVSVLPVEFATPLSALIFALHHGRLDTMIPLTALGLVWALLYLLSGNLFVNIVVHAMWNSRVFIGSFLGK